MPEVTRIDIFEMVRGNFPNLSEETQLELADKIKSLLEFAANDKITDLKWVKRVIDALAVSARLQ
ncbi:MAG: hypothetical protein Q7T54_01590 [Candidatus Levybacteria bacterium]|nr:hypothetical protein [Candidatus Levybacteria bacterium]